MKSSAVFIFSILLLQSGIICSRISTLRRILTQECANGRSRTQLLYHNPYAYELECNNSTFNRNLSSGDYRIPYCDDESGDFNKCICSTNLAASPSVPYYKITYHEVTRAILLILTTSQCEPDSNDDDGEDTEESSDIADQNCPTSSVDEPFDGLRCRVTCIPDSQTEQGCEDRCCTYSCGNFICVNQESCEINSSTDEISPPLSTVSSTLEPSNTPNPIQTVGTRFSTTSPVATPTLFPTPSISISRSPTNSPRSTATNFLNDTAIRQENTIMLILVTAIPGAFIIILIILIVSVFVVIAGIYFQRRTKELDSHPEEGHNYETLNGHGSNSNANLNFELPTIQENGQAIGTQEPMYMEISDTIIANSFAKDALKIETNPNLTQPTNQRVSVASSDQYALILNDLYSGLVEGAVIDPRTYEELPNQTPDTQLFRLSDSLVMNSTYNFSRENETLNPFIEPSKNIPELENNLQCSLLQIKKEDLEIGEQFASGHFGIVYRATYHTQKGDIPVAVKSLKQADNSDVTLAFMREAATLAQFSHPNVLRLIGVLTSQHQQQPWMIVTELLSTELREFLLKLKLPNRNSSSSSNSDLQLQGVVLHTLLLKFSQEIAAGMAYLTEKKFIHRDLAARNVLVAKDLTVRVADFGMSREIDSPENNYYTSSGGRVPLRWTAPEALFFMKYSEKSDVWSFGVTLYEIWSLGDKPWGNASNEEVIQALSTERILSAPIGCPEDVYQVMVQTWMKDKTVRPTFNELKTILSNVNLSFYHKLTEIK